MEADDARLEAAIEQAFAALEAAGGELARVTDARQQTLVVIVAAQGVIDNGGLAYFLEHDWPGRPDYALFVSAYLAIGAAHEAGLLEQALALLGLEQPEADLAGRRAALAGPVGARLRELDARFGDLQSLRPRLAAFVAGEPEG